MLGALKGVSSFEGALGNQGGWGAGFVSLFVNKGGVTHSSLELPDLVRIIRSLVDGEHTFLRFVRVTT